MFEPDSSTFGIALLDCGPVLRTRFDQKLCAAESSRPVDTLIGIYAIFFRFCCYFGRLGSGAADAETCGDFPQH